MTQLDTNLFDYIILAIYFALVITIGILARRAIATSEDFLLSGPVIGRLDHGPGVHLGQPGRDRDSGHGG